MHTRSIVAVSAVLAAVACGDDARSPTEPPANSQAAVSAPTALTFWQVGAGGSHTCGITMDYRAYCWGSGSGLGDGSPTPAFRDRPIAVAGTLRFRHVSAGTDFTCAVALDRRAYCWGWNGYGQLGDGTTAWERLVPTPVAGGLQFRQVDAGRLHACGVTYPDNRVYCWGRNQYGQLGDGTITDRGRPVAVLGGRVFRQVSTGYFHSCAVTTGNAAYCWGANFFGQVGDSTAVRRRQRPVLVSGGRSFRQVDAGDTHTCGVSTGERAFCWGDGRGGQLGNGNTYLSYWPRRVSGGRSFDRVTAGGTHSCGETTMNRAYCWGTNWEGQVGDGTTTTRLTPVAVAGRFYFRQLSSGTYHTCGKSSADAAYCWGSNGSVQLGDGTQINRLSPTPVADPM
jgi:alpha-tubulin suppressor-like RCC1 family protein